MFPTALALLALATSPASAEEPLSLDLRPQPTQAPLVLTAVDTPQTGAGGGGGAKHRSPLLAAGLNFFLPGTGYLYNGEKPVYVSLPMVAGAVGLTYVEQFHQFENGSLQEQDPTAFGVMFGAVLLVNTGTAIDAWREAKAINRGELARRGGGDSPRRSVALLPTALPTEGQVAYGLNLDARF